MSSTLANREERIGLAVAIIAHLALLAVLVFRPPAGDVVVPPQRIEVTISDEVGLTSTSPQPFAEAAPDVAPMIGDAPQPAVQDAPAPREVERPVAAPPEPPRPAPRQASRPAPREASRPAPREPSRPARREAAPPRPAPPSPAPRAERAGGSRIGSNFLEGTSDSTGSSRSSPAAEIGPRVQASLGSAISRQLKPHWSAPQGADAELLVTLVKFRLNRDGSLSGSPTVVGQSGVTPANETQKGRHAEQAIRAVRLAAPFDLPEEFYEGWKVVTSRFDRRLSE